MENENNQEIEVKTKKKRRSNVHCWQCKKKLIKDTSEGFVDEPNLICPSCGAEFADKPFIEARLHILQKEYLQTRDSKIFGEMLKLMQDITYNQIVSRLRSSGVFLDPEDIKDKVHWGLEKMIILYSNPNFRITTSFIEYIGNVVLYPLYNYKQKDKDENEISMFTPIGHSKGSDKEYTYFDQLKETPVLTGYNETEEYFYSESHKEHTINIVNDYIDKVVTISNKKRDFATALKMAVLFNQYLNKKSEKFFAGWWKTEGITFRDYFEKSVTLLRDTIYYATQS